MMRMIDALDGGMLFLRSTWGDERLEAGTIRWELNGRKRIAGAVDVGLLLLLLPDSIGVARVGMMEILRRI